jgi:hypothetical protein
VTRHLAIVAKSQPDMICHDVLQMREALADETARMDRLMVRIDELVEEGFTTNEIRRQLMKVDLANAGDCY